MPSQRSGFAVDRRSGSAGAAARVPQHEIDLFARQIRGQRLGRGGGAGIVCKIDAKPLTLDARLGVDRVRCFARAFEDRLRAGCLPPRGGSGDADHNLGRGG